MKQENETPWNHDKETYFGRENVHSYKNSLNALNTALGRHTIEQTHQF